MRCGTTAGVLLAAAVTLSASVFADETSSSDVVETQNRDTLSATGLSTHFNALGSAGQVLRIRDEAWIKVQPAHHYTLQVAALDTRERATEYVRSKIHAGDVAIAHVTGPDGSWYKVLLRSFDSRNEALAVRDAYLAAGGGTDPWLRTFREIQGELDGTSSNGAERNRTVGDGAVKGSASPEEVSATLRRAQSRFNRQKYLEAYSLWFPLAQNGEAEAQYGLGFLFESGWGVQRNYETAFAWYLKAAEAGHAKAQFNLGLMFVQGHGVAPDLEKGTQWIESAAQNNDKRAIAYMEQIENIE